MTETTTQTEEVKRSAAEARIAERRRRALAKYAAYRAAKKDAPPRNHRVPMRCDYCRTNGVEVCDRCVRCIACCGCEAYDKTLHDEVGGD